MLGRRLARLWLWALSASAAVVDDARGQAVADPNFVLEVIHSGAGVVPLTFGPGARLYVGEKGGRILVFEPDGSGGYLPPQVFATVDAHNTHERGLLGLETYYPSSGPPQLFVFYSRTTDQKLVRYAFDETNYTQPAGSPVTVLSGLVNTATNHNGGDLAFWNGALYVALGDDAMPWLAQDLSLYNGKILRVDENGLGLPDNPFYDGDPASVTSRIWGLGCRNAFRFYFHNDAMYVSENGNSIDRVSRWGAAGANGGWPGEFTVVSDPNVVNLFTQPPSVTGIGITTGGPFADPDFPGSDALYLGNYNWDQRNVRRWRLTGSQLDSAVPFASGHVFLSGFFPGIADLLFGPDGLYLTTTEQDGSIGAVYRVRYSGGTPPAAAIGSTPDPATGTAPLIVNFADLSTDDGSIASRVWDFGDGSTSFQPNPSHSFAQGVYTVSLTVTDDLGLTDTTTIEVSANQATVVDLSGTIFDGRNYASAGLPVATEIRLYQLDGVTPLAFPGGAGPNGNASVVPSGGAFDFSAVVELTGCGIVVSAGEPASDGVQPAFRGIPIVCDSSSHAASIDFHLSDTALTGRVLDTLSAPAQVDLGVSRGSPGSLFAVAGGRDFLAPIPPSGVPHRLESDALGYYYVSIPSGQGGVNFYVDVVADTNQDVYLPTTYSQSVPSGARITRNVTLGLQSGGANCMAMPGPGGPVGYGQVQAIFNANCIGCHSGLDPNGGLDLSQGNSYDAIVGVASREVPGLKLVEPGDAGLSFLMEKINCSLPQVGIRMPTGFSLSPGDQGLVRDWINQGALPSIAPPQISCPGDGALSCAPPGGLAVNYSVTVVSDDPSVSVVCDIPSGAVFPGGTTTVTCTATDFLNQTDVCSFDVTINLETDDHAFIRGNVNSRRLHALDIGDVIDLVNSLFGGFVLDFDCAAASDVNDDGDRNIVDVVALTQSVFGATGYAIPPPTGAPGIVDVDGGSIPSTLGCIEGENCE